MDVNFLLRKTLFNWALDVAVIALIFCWRMEKRRPFALRIWLLPLSIVIFDADLSQWLNLPNLSSFFVIDGVVNLSFLARFSIMILALWRIFDSSLWRILYYGTAAHLVQHLISSLANAILLAFFNGQETPLYMGIRSALTLSFFALVVGEQYWETRYQNVNVDNRFIILFSTVCTLVINLFNNVVKEMLNMHSVITYIYASIVSALLLMIQFGMREMKRRDKDKEIVEALLAQQAKQRDAEMKNNSILNMKCHDLKHQILALRQMSDDEERSRSIDELERAVMLYDSKIKTGNPSLDVLLTEKSLQCEAEKIRFTVVADGSALSFLSATELYSVFGNMLDNAMEAVSALKDEARRQISLRIERKESIVTVVCENCFDGQLTMTDGLPETTKGNRNDHGYGLKSIRYIVHQHGGHMKTEIQNGQYKLILLFFPEN